MEKVGWIVWSLWFLKLYCKEIDNRRENFRKVISVRFNCCKAHRFKQIKIFDSLGSVQAGRGEGEEKRPWQVQAFAVDGCTVGACMTSDLVIALVMAKAASAPSAAATMAQGKNSAQSLPRSSRCLPEAPVSM